jgi:hypothetical protein
MKLSHFWKVATHAINEKLQNILWNLKAHCHVYKTPQLVPYCQQDQSRLSHPIRCLRTTSILSTHLYLGLPTSVFPSGFPSILHEVKLPLCLTKHYAMKTYGRVDLQSHTFIDSTAAKERTLKCQEHAHMSGHENEPILQMGGDWLTKWNCNVSMSRLLPDRKENVTL